MPSRSFAEFAAKVVAFLDEALVEVVPERHVAIAERFRMAIVEQWPTDDEAWAVARKGIAEALAEHFIERPEDWARALHLATTYLDRVHLDAPHSRHEGEARMFVRGKPVYPAELGMGQALAAAFLERASPDQRKTFFESLDTWEEWTITARALEHLRPTLSGQEVMSLVAHARPFSTGDIEPGSVLGRIRESLHGSGPSIDTILWGWLSDRPPYDEADAPVVGLLAVWHLPSHDDADALRGRLVQKLARLPVDRGGALSLRIALHSWSTGTPLELRERLFLDTLEELGSEAIGTALRVLAFDPQLHGLDALPILDAIVSRIEEENDDTIDGRLAALRRIAEHLPSGETNGAALVFQRLPRARTFPPGSSRPLDFALSTLAKHDPEATRSYVLDWIEEHHLALIERGEALAQALCLTRDKLPGFEWLLEAAVSSRPGLRRGALRCLFDPELRPDALRSAVLGIDYTRLTSKQVLGFARTLLSQAPWGDITIEMLFAIARTRPDCLDQMKEVLGPPAMHAYPGCHQRCAEEWAATLTDASSDVEKEVVTDLQAAIEKRRRTFEAREQRWDVLFARSRPTAEPVHIIVQRQMREAQEHNRTGFLAEIARVPLACGERWSDAETPNQSTPLKSISSSFEGLAHESYDPLAARLERMEHRRAADHLLGDTTKDEGQT